MKHQTLIKLYSALFVYLLGINAIAADTPLEPESPPPDFLISHNPVRILNFPSVLILYRTDAGNALGGEIRRVQAGDDLKGWGLAATYRIYPWDDDLSGGYIEPFFAAHSISDSQKDDLLYSYGFVGGYQLILWDWLAFGPGFGLEYFTSDALINASQGASSANATTLNPYLRIDFGVVF